MGKRYLTLLAALFALLALTACRPVTAPGDASATQGDAAATQDAAAGTWEPVDCATLDVAPKLAEVAQCGYVTVPENRAAGTDATIKLAVVRVPSTGENPGAPVFMGTGGPGGDGLQRSSARAGGDDFVAAHAAILADRDWVFFSQRGSPHAEPELGCPDFDNVKLEAAVKGWNADEKLVASKEALQSCFDGFKAQGIDIAGYNSVENAEDVDAIRQALSYDKIVYYGQSYGTLLGQYLLRAHPEILDAIILDGIAPATATRWTDVTNIPESFERVFNACAADAACNARYPDLEAQLTKAMDALKANPPLFPLSDGKGGAVELKVDDTLAMNALFINLYIAGGYSQLPDIIYKLAGGDYSALSSNIPLFYQDAGLNRGQHLAIACSDDPVASVDELHLDGPAVYNSLILDDANMYITACSLLGLPQLPASSDELVKSDVPALLLQGGLDPATPVSGGDNVAEGLPDSYNIVVPAGSHIQLGSPCINGIMAAFMRDPQTAPDTSCIDPGVHFAITFDKPTPVTATSPNASAAVTMVLPAGFRAAAPGQWLNDQYQVYLTAFDAGATIDDIAQQSAARLPAKVEITDGPTIGGLPSKAINTILDVQGTKVAVDIYVFGDERGVYNLSSQILDGGAIDSIRQDALPALLESITVK